MSFALFFLPDGRASTFGRSSLSHFQSPKVGVKTYPPSPECVTAGFGFNQSYQSVHIQTAFECMFSPALFTANGTVLFSLSFPVFGESLLAALVGFFFPLKLTNIFNYRQIATDLDLQR